MSQQHRPKRDAAKAKEIQDLRSENNSLRKQVARLRRQIEKLQENVVIEDPEDRLSLKPPSSSEPFCGSCKSTNVRQFATPNKILLCCGDCQYKAPVAA